MDNLQQTDTTQSQEIPPGMEKKLELTASRQFTSWLLEQKASLAFTTYQAGKLFFIGLQQDGKMSVFERTFNRCMGLYADDSELWMSSLYQLWRFKNTLESGQIFQGFDRLYVPQLGYTTGDLDVHDVAVDKNGRVIFVNTLFSCLATTSGTHNFQPLWKPEFISKLAAEDRCHLNGLAMENGEAKYVTAVSTTDVHEGWREHRTDGGVVIDVKKNKVVAEGLSMPHSPRMYKGKLYLLNSGTGEFGWVDVKKGKFNPIAFLPGYTRGLSFIGDFAVIGLSKSRQNKTFSGLALDQLLKDKKTEARCGIQVIDLKSGDLVHSLRIEGLIEELYDVVTLHDAIRPMALGFKTDEIRRMITVDEEGKL